MYDNGEAVDNGYGGARVNLALMYQMYQWRPYGLAQDR
jgi:hypothetical protein